MNLADFFSPPSLDQGAPHDHRNLLSMPPRFAKDALAPFDTTDLMAPAVLDSRFDRSGRPLYVPNTTTTTTTNIQLERIECREKSNRGVRPSDVTFYVGRNRAPYTLAADSLKHSTYFASLISSEKLQQQNQRHFLEPIVLDCEETIFQHMVLILRYGSFEALPKMSESELFRLKRELECYGIDVPEPIRKSSSPPSAPSTPSHRSNSYPYSSNPQTPTHASQQQHHQHHQQLRPIHHPTTMADYPDLPEELRDASMLVLVARVDEDDKGRCECTAKDQHTYWALSFHHRHTFCTGCGKCPSTMTPRFQAEMYMAAAMYYSSETVTNKQRWSVGCDSTCSLKLLHAKPCCVCPCVSSSSDKSCCGGGSCNSSNSSSGVVGSGKSSNVWAVSTYHSHAFCTQCGQAADDRTLICILLTLRYGGISKQSKLRRDRTISSSSEGMIAQESRSSSRVLEPSRHSRGNRSL